jgi:hypothetical protein
VEMTGESDSAPFSLGRLALTPARLVLE